MAFDRAALRAQLIEHEGYRPSPYTDTVGALTIGIGHNLTAKGLTAAQIERLFSDDIDDTCAEIARHAPWFDALSDARQLVIVDMCFNLGWPRLARFTRMLAAIEVGDYDAAADQMLDSKWAHQVGRRARTLARMMREG